MPTMSKAPRAETQLLRAPVRDGEPSPEPDVLRAGVEMQVTLSCGAGGPQGPRGERGAREKALHGTKHAVLEEQAPVAAVWNHHHPPAWSACGGRGGHQGIVGAEDRELAVRQSSREGWRPESDQSANAAAVAYLEEVAGEDPSQARQYVDVQLDSIAAEVHLFSDGRFGDASGFTAGNLQFNYHRMGRPGPEAGREGRTRAGGSFY